VPLNLRGTSASRLGFTTVLAATEAIHAALSAALERPLSEERLQDFVEHLGRKSQRLVARLTVFQHEDRILLEWNAHPSPEDRHSNTKVKPGQLLDVVSRVLSQPEIIHVECVFEYSPKNYDLLFPLPIKLGPPISAFGFDEIKGLRLSKALSGGNECHVVLDQPAEEFQAMVVMDLEERIDSALPERILKLAMKTVGPLVRSKRSEAVAGVIS
jgi:hypothetical protein